MAAPCPAIPAAITRNGRTAPVTIGQRCLWHGVFGSRPVRALAVTEPGKPGLALVTTDMTTPATIVIERYAARWGIESGLLRRQEHHRRR
jgi:hypothetical protein